MKTNLKVKKLPGSEVLGLSVYALSQSLNLTIIVIHLINGSWTEGGILLSVWLLQGLIQVIQEFWGVTIKPTFGTVMRLVCMGIALPMYIVLCCIKTMLGGITSPQYGGVTYNRWRIVLLITPLTICLQGGILLTSWGDFHQKSLVIWFQIISLVVGLVDIVISGSCWRVTVRESDPLIWYKPHEETDRQGSFLHRVVKAVSTALQVEYGSTNPTSRLPLVDKLDQRVVIKKTGLPTLLHIPRSKELLRQIVPTSLHVIYRLSALVIFCSYLQVYTAVPVIVTACLTAVTTVKIIKFDIRDSLISAILSVGIPATSTSRTTPPAPVRTTYLLLNTSINIVVTFISFAVTLGTVPSSSQVSLPILSCANYTQNFTELGRKCMDDEPQHQVLSICLAGSILVGILSLVSALLEYRSSLSKLVLQSRIWSEKLKSYQDPNLNGVMKDWRLATSLEVQLRRREIVTDFKSKTVNKFRISRCQGLAIPHCKLKDGVILPKLDFSMDDDVVTVTTEEEDFKTFDNLFGLRFTRYVVLIKDSR